MQSSEAWKIKHVITLFIALVYVSSGNVACKAVHTDMSLFHRMCPMKRLFDYIDYYLSSHNLTTLDFFPYARRHFRQYHGKSLRLKTRTSDDIDIVVRLFKKRSKRHHTKSKSQDLQKENGSVLDFQRSLGPRAKSIRNRNGTLIGIDLGGPSTIFSRSTIPRISHLHVNRQGLMMEAAGDNNRQHFLTDMDQCCTTNEMFFTNSSLTDVMGVRRRIAHSRQSLQFIRHGLCSGRGECRGECVQMFVNMALAIHPPDPGERYTFKFFEIPGYCACKRFG